MYGNKLCVCVRVCMCEFGCTNECTHGCKTQKERLTSIVESAIAVLVRHQVGLYVTIQYSTKHIPGVSSHTEREEHSRLLHSLESNVVDSVEVESVCWSTTHNQHHESNTLVVVLPTRPHDNPKGMPHCTDPVKPFDRTWEQLLSCWK